MDKLELETLERMLKSELIEDVELAISIIEGSTGKAKDYGDTFTQGIIDVINKSRYYHNTMLAPKGVYQGFRYLPNKYGKIVADKLTNLLWTKYGIK